ncbi:MAG: ribosome assembly cofactor RimP [Flavobacteriaceae bacterium]|nr:ribosome assembly cofactor RimP [Flavobacteriaceae bacterium]
MNTVEVQRLIQEAIDENPELFLVDWSILPGNKIEVLVDGDHGLDIEEVVRISRHIEHNLDREQEDFSLMVSSPGINRSLNSPRQFKKNIGRKIKINSNNNEIEGTLIAANEQDIIVEWKVRENKPVGKGKHTVTKTETINYNDIQKAIIQIEI